MLDAYAKHRKLPATYQGARGQRNQVPQGPGPPPGGVGQPWYLYPMIDNYGSPDPYGGFPKPDINFIMPPGKSITTLSSGTVTAVDNPQWGYSVTMKMDQPYNQIADHEAYIHMDSPSVSVGQHINPGDQVGIGGGNQVPPGNQQAGVGFAFYHGDDYGFGPTWSQYDGSSWLDPTNFINQVRGTGSGGPCIGPLCLPSINLDPCQWPIFQWFCPGTSPNWTDILIRVLLVVTGAILIIVGASALVHSENMQTLNPPQQQQSSSKNNNTQNEDEESQPKDEKSDESSESSEASEGAESSEATEAAEVAAA